MVFNRSYIAEGIVLLPWDQSSNFADIDPHAAPVNSEANFDGNQLIQAELWRSRKNLYTIMRKGCLCCGFLPVPFMLPRS